MCRGDTGLGRQTSREFLTSPLSPCKTIIWFTTKAERERRETRRRARWALSSITVRYSTAGGRSRDTPTAPSRNNLEFVFSVTAPFPSFSHIFIFVHESRKKRVFERLGRVLCLGWEIMFRLRVLCLGDDFMFMLCALCLGGKLYVCVHILCLGCVFDVYVDISMFRSTFLCLCWDSYVYIVFLCLCRH